MDAERLATEQAKFQEPFTRGYEGGAARADEQDVRRLMLELLPTHLILDREHMQSLMNEPQT